MTKEEKKIEEDTSGLGFEYIFAKTRHIPPAEPSNSWGYEQPSPPWFSEALNLDYTNNNLWRNQRTIRGEPTVGDAVSANWEGTKCVR